MRIGVMLRHLDQHGGGVAVYTRSLLDELLRIGGRHEYVLLYRHRAQIGRFPAVEEVALPAASRLLWDQVAVGRAARRLGVDVVFNPKYSVPLVGSVPSVWVCHGLDWYTAPRWSKPIDRLNHRLLIPLYASKASTVIAVSNFVRDELTACLGLPPARVRTVHHGLDPRFRQPVDAATRARVRAAHDLPEKYLLYVGQIYPPKNFGRLIDAYAAVAERLALPLLVAGEHRWLSEVEVGRALAADMSGKVRFLGWVGHDDLPALYAQATALTMPSLYEGFGMPILEAMAAGCPVLTSDRTASSEIAGEAGLLVDPQNTTSIAHGLCRIAADAALRERMVTAGRHRALSFTWRRCALETLDILEAAAIGMPRRVLAGSRGHRTA